MKRQKTQKRIGRILSFFMIVALMIQTVSPVAASAADPSDQCTVTLSLVDGESSEGVSMPAESTGSVASVPRGTKISQISYPEKWGYFFKGWYYDAAGTQYAYPDDVISTDKTLYAAFTSRNVSVTDDRNGYVASMDVKDLNFRFVVTAVGPDGLTEEELQRQAVMQTMGIREESTALAWTAETIKQNVRLRDQYDDVQIDFTVTPVSGQTQTYEITAVDGFVAGKVYQLDISGAKGLYIVYDGETQPSTVVYHNITIYREEVMNFSLEDGIRYIPLSAVQDMGELEPLLTVESVDLSTPFENMTKLEQAVANNATTSIAEKKESDVPRTGSFTYRASASLLPKVGDTVCIYAGNVSPKNREGNSTEFMTDDKATYVIIDSVDGFVFNYHIAEAMDVIDTPIVVPVDAAADLDAGDGNRFTMPASGLQFEADGLIPFKMDGKTVTYGDMKLEGGRSVRAGDYLALYTVTNGDVTEQNMKSPRIVKITGINTKEVSDIFGRTETRAVISYVSSTMEELQSSMQVHAKQEYEVTDDFIEEHKDEVTRLAEEQFEEADKTPLLMGAIMDKSVTGKLMSYGINPSTTLIVDKDDNLLNADQLDLKAMKLDFSSTKTLLAGAKDADKVTAEMKYLSFEPEFYNKLTHYNRKGLALTATIRGKIEVTINKVTAVQGDPNEGKGKINIDFSATFTQELFIDENFDIDIEWEWFVIPVDIKATACIDIGTWTNFTANLKVSTGYEDDPFDSDDFDEDNGYINASELKNLNDKIIPKIKDAKEAAEWSLDIDQSDYIFWEEDEKSIVEHIQDDDEDDEDDEDGTEIGAFEQAYKEVLDGVDDTWMTLIKIGLGEFKHSFLGVICVKLEIGLTLSICGTIELGMEYNYDFVRRYSATFRVFDFAVTTNSTDINKPHTTFSLYAIGAFGVKPALYIELAVGLIDTDLDSISVTMEAGVVFMIFLYGYLNVDSWKEERTQFQGGVYISMKFALDVSLGAQIGKGALGTSKQIYGLDVPLADMGSRYQIRGIALDDEDVGEDGVKYSDTVEVFREVKNRYGYFDITKEERTIWALDMLEGDVVEYIPEVDEYTYEIVTGWVNNDPDQPLQPDGVTPLETGKTLSMAQMGKKSADKTFYNLFGQGEQDPDTIKTYERVYLDDDDNASRAKFYVTVKMTYIPPTGVMVKGRQYTKIIHYIVDQTEKGHYIAYANDWYNQDGKFRWLGDNYTTYPFMPGISVSEQSRPENNTLHIVGYVFNGFKGHLGIGDLYGQYWIPATDEEIAEQAYTDASDGTPGGRALIQNIKYTIDATPKQQRIHVRHWVINTAGTDYELLAENNNWTTDWFVSDQDYVFRTGDQVHNLYRSGVFNALTADENMNIPDLSRMENFYRYERDYNTGFHATFTTPDGTVTDLKAASKLKVTPTDSTTPIGTLDIYYEKRAEYTLRCVAVDENGNMIREISERAAGPKAAVGCTIALPSAEYLETGLTGFEFDGWYNTEAFDKLNKDVQNNHIMPDHDITVYYKVKSVPMALTVLLQCEDDGDVIDKRQVSTAGGEIFTVEELLGTMFVPYNSLQRADTIGNIIPSDRQVADGELAKSYIMGGFIYEGYGHDTVTIKVTESSAKPQDLKVRIVVKESAERHLKEGEDKIYWEEVLTGSAAGCGARLILPTEITNYLVAAPEGWSISDFYIELPAADGGEPEEFLLIDTVPVFAANHLDNTDTEWVSYDVETNTLTYTFRARLYPSSIEYTVKYWSIAKDGTEKVFKTEKKTATANERLNTEATLGMTVYGSEPATDRNPDTFEVMPDGSTVVNYYYRVTSYPFTFTVKDQQTGEVLYTSDTYYAGAHNNFYIPAAVTTGAAAALEQQGYEFVGWQNAEAQYYPKNTAYIVSAAVTSGTYEAVFEKKNVKVILHWTDNSLISFSDTKYSTRMNGSGITATRTLKAHTSFTIPTPATRNGAVFDGWYTDPGFAEGTRVTGPLTISADTDYYAHVIGQFDITFVGKGDETDPCNYKVAVKQSYKKLVKGPSTPPVRSNYVFDGWSLTEGGSQVSLSSLTSTNTESRTLYALWKPAKYTITFDLDGGTWSQPSNKITHEYNTSTSYAPSETPTREGYTFAGWKNSRGEIYTATQISYGPTGLRMDVTFTAVWTPVDYTITVELNGGALPAGKAIPTTWNLKGREISLGNYTPSKDHATFKGWYTNSDFNGDKVTRINSSTTPGNITLYAKWEEKSYPVRLYEFSVEGYQINLEGCPYNIPSTYKVAPENISLYDVGSFNHWNFVRWEVSTDGDYFEDRGKCGDISCADLTGTDLYIRAFYSRDSYGITYDYNDGEAGAGAYPAQAYYDEEVLTPRPVREGFIFTGWKVSVDGEDQGTVQQGFSMTYENDIVLTAQWVNERGQSGDDVKNYTVKLYLNGVESDSKTGTTYNDIVYASDLYGVFTPDTARYAFSDIKVSGSGTSYGAYSNVPVTDGAVYNVYYTTLGYTVLYVVDNAVHQSFALHYDDVIPAPTQTPAKAGYTFKGWDPGLTADTKVSDRAPALGSTITINGLGWEPVNHTITYVGWPEGVTNDNPTTYTCETASFRIDISQFPARTGYYVDATAIWVDTYGATEDLTVTIPWAKETYQIFYDTNGGTLSSANSAALMTEYTVETAAESYTLPQPTRNGYTFEGWKLIDSTGADVTKVPVTGRLESYTLEAQWTHRVYQIKYDYKGATKRTDDTDNTPDTYREYAGLGYIRMPDLTKEGYTFEGYDVYVRSTGEHVRISPVYRLFMLPAEGSDLAVTALFSMTECHVTYNYNDGGDTEHPAVDPGNDIEYFDPNETTVVVKAPTRTGYIFNGWKCDKKLNGLSANSVHDLVILDSTTVADTEITLTAQWRPQPYYITYNLGAGTLTTTNKITLDNGVPTAGTVTNPTIYSILNTIALTDPVRSDGVAFLGWTSEQFGSLEYYTGYELGSVPASTAQVAALLNASALSGQEYYLEHFKQQGIVLTAKWADGSYSIYYNLAGGSLPAGSTNPASYRNTTASFTLVNPVKTGYAFVGWLPDGESTPLDSVTVGQGSYGDKYFTAVWEHDSHTITYDLKGGYWTDPNRTGMTVFSMDDLMIYVGEGLGKRSSVFDKWWIYNAADPTTPVTHIENGGAITLGTLFGEGEPYDLLVVASWVAERNLMTIDLDGGSWPDGLAEGLVDWSPYSFVMTGQTVYLRDPVRTGYDFTGWEIIGEAGSSVTVSSGTTAGSHDITIPEGTEDFGLKAQWSESTDIPYTVYYLVKSSSGDYLPFSNEVLTGETGTVITQDALIELANGIDGSILDEVQVYSNGSHLSSEDITILGDGSLEIYLSVSAPMYSITYYIGGVVSDVHGYLAGDAIIPNNPVYTGHTFNGWFSDPECETPYIFGTDATMGNESFAVYGYWTADSYTIEYLNWPEGVENPNPATYTITDADFYVTYPTLNPDATGYDYGGLTDTDVANRTLVAVNGRTGNITVETVWHAHEFSITYPSAGGTAYTYESETPVVYTYNVAATIPAISAVGPAAGKEFLSWKASANGTTFDLTDGVIPAGTKGDITLIPVFDSDCTITYLGLEGSSFETQNPNRTNYDTEGEQFTLENPEKDGYTFAGWQVEGGATTDELTLPNAEIPGSFTVTATWTPVQYSVYSTDFDGESSYLYYTIEDTSGEAGVVLTPKTKTDYTFTGWTVTKSDDTPVTVYADNKLPAGTFGDLTAVAQYEYTGAGYTITYDLGEGGSRTSGVDYPESYLPEDVSDGNTMSLPLSAERNGYEFNTNGWKMITTGHPEGIDFVTALTESIFADGFSDITLQANWTAVPYQISYEGDFEDKNNTEKYPQSYTIEGNVVLPDPELTGYEFSGWTARYADTDEPFTLTDGNTVPAGTTGNLVITANWEDPAAVTFHVVINRPGKEPVTGDYDMSNCITAAWLMSLIPAEDPDRDSYTGIVYTADHSAVTDTLPIAGETYEFTVEMATDMFYVIILDAPGYPELVRKEFAVGTELTEDMLLGVLTSGSEGGEGGEGGSSSGGEGGEGGSSSGSEGGEGGSSSGGEGGEGGSSQGGEGGGSGAGSPVYTGLLVQNADGTWSEFTTPITGEKDETYTFRIKEECTVTLNSFDVDTYQSVSGAILSGGGAKYVGESITITAYAVPGYSFAGWYDEAGNRIGTALSHNITVDGDVTYTARYEKYAPVTLTILTVDGSLSSSYTTNVGDGTGIETMDNGTTRVLMADPSKFVKWQTADGRTLSDQSTLTITVYANAQIVLVEKQESKTIVEFIGPNSQIVKTAFYGAGETFGTDLDAANAPSRYGYTFSHWSLTEGGTAITAADVEAGFGSTERIRLYAVYTPVYTVSPETCQINVYVDGDLSTVMSEAAHNINNLKTLVAPEVPDMTFKWWAKGSESGEILSYNETYYLKTVKSVDIYAVYGTSSSAEEAEVEPSIGFVSVFRETVDDKHNVTAMAVRSIPDAGYELIEHGILYTKGNTEGWDLDDLENGMIIEHYNRVIGTNDYLNGYYLLHVNMTGREDDTVGLRAYMIVKNIRTGNIETIYSMPVSTTWNTLQ